MRAANLGAQTLRHSESGLVWEEQLSGAAGTLEILRFSTFRVRAAAVGTVTIDGVLAATMAIGEILIFNAGSGSPTDTKPTVTVVITGAQFVQVARSTERAV